MSSAMIFLIVACLAVGNVHSEDLLFRSHTDYVYTKYSHGTVASVTIDGVNVTKARDGTHCVPPNDCWEMVSKTNYIIVSGVLKGEHASIVVQPPQGSKRSPVGFVYKKKQAKYPTLGDDVQNVYTKKVADETKKILHIIVFDDPTGSHHLADVLLLNPIERLILGLKEVNVSGNVSTANRDWNQLTLLGKTGFACDDVVLFTGHVTDKARNMQIKFENGHVYNLNIKPSNEHPAPSAVMTYIDYKDAFKLK